MLPVPYDILKYGDKSNPYDATNMNYPNDIGYVCPQLDETSSIFEGSTNEDCLRLSIYTPKINPNKTDTLLPVLVWIHGGHFISGSGMYQYYGPERFMKDNDIVMVSINYRLGTLGFLSLGTPELPGNAGLWDQVEALKWIQTNIKYFGGDNKKVTIMGESAGSWSVMYQLLSPASAGLFQRVISQSGTPMSPAYHEYTQDKAKEYGQMIAEDLNCSKNNLNSTQDQLKCLQNVNVTDILSREPKNRTKYPSDSPLGPQAVIDGGFLPSNSSFLPMSPKMMMVMGQYNQNVDTIIGCNKDEGLKFTKDAYLNHTVPYQWQKEWLNWTEYDEGGRGYMYMLGLDKQDSVANNRLDAINKAYLGSLENMTFDNINEITSMYTDSWYCYSGHDFITRHISNVKENNTYQYIYTHKGESSPLGVSHGDELNLQFYPYLEDVIPLEEEDQKMSDLFIELWKSFIKNGSPTAKTVAWEPIWDINDRHYLNLSTNAFMEDLSGNYEERMNFWDNLMNGVFDS